MLKVYKGLVVFTKVEDVLRQKDYLGRMIKYSLDNSIHYGGYVGYIYKQVYMNR